MPVDRTFAQPETTRAAAVEMFRALELHEALAHAHGGRTVRDLGDAIVLHDGLDRDPFVNRVSALRLPSEPAAYERRVAELLTLFAAMDRRPHIRVSARFDTPPDLAQRLLADGFVDLGGTHAMALDPAPRPAVPLPAGALLERLSSAGTRREAVVAGAARVMNEAFGAEIASAAQIGADLARTTGAAWDVCLVSVAGEPVAAGRRYTADGMTYLSSIGTRPSWWGRGFGATITLTLANDGRRAGGHLVHLGVESHNARAQRLYSRLGFVMVGDRIADLLLG